MLNFSYTRTLQGLELIVCGLGLGPRGLGLGLESCGLGFGLGGLDYITGVYTQTGVLP